MIAFIIGTILVSTITCIETDNEYYMSFEPLPGQTDSWPVARLAVLEFTKETESGREVRRETDCRYFHSVFEAARLLDNLSKEKVKRIPKEHMDELKKRCKRGWFDNISTAYSDFKNWVGDKTQMITDLASGIYPGTKWCGAGNKASSYEDLGEHRKTDMCCRDHDHCENIPSGGQKYGLVNTNMFTVLNCKCDDVFKQCLTNANTDAATRLITIYFGVYDPDCFYLKCKKRSLFERRQQCPAVKISYKDH